MSDSVWPHRWQPTRLPCPGDSPGKNSGVGCHFLLQSMKVKSQIEVSQSCPTLSDPVDCSLSTMVQYKIKIFKKPNSQYVIVAYFGVTHSEPQQKPWQMKGPIYMSSHNQWNIIESFSSGIRGFSYLFIHLANIYWAPTMCTHSHRYRGKIRKSLLPPIWGESREDRWQQTETIHNSAESVSALLGGGRIWEDFGVDSFDQKPEKTQGVSHICLKEGHLSKCQVRPWGGSLCLRKSKETGISK